MTSTFALPQGRARKGFSLVELSVVVIIIGVLAAFGVPRLMASVEQSKASEAFKYLSAVRSAQARYQVRQGTFTDTIGDLDLDQPAPTYFGVGALAAGPTADLETSWQLTLTRAGAAGGFGAYTVTFNQDGFDAGNSTITDRINPQATP